MPFGRIVAEGERLPSLSPSPSPYCTVFNEESSMMLHLFSGYREGDVYVLFVFFLL